MWKSLVSDTDIYYNEIVGPIPMQPEKWVGKPEGSPRDLEG